MLDVLGCERNSMFIMTVFV